MLVNKKTIVKKYGVSQQLFVLTMDMQIIFEAAL